MTESSIIKKIKRAEETAARHKPGTCYHTRAVNDANRWRRRLKCLRETGSLAKEAEF